MRPNAFRLPPSSTTATFCLQLSSVARAIAASTIFAATSYVSAFLLYVFSIHYPPSPLAVPCAPHCVNSSLRVISGDDDTRRHDIIEHDLQLKRVPQSA